MYLFLSLNPEVKYGLFLAGKISSIDSDSLLIKIILIVNTIAVYENGSFSEGYGHYQSKEKMSAVILEVGGSNNVFNNGKNVILIPIFDVWIHMPFSGRSHTLLGVIRNKRRTHFVEIYPDNILVSKDVNSCIIKF